MPAAKSLLCPPQAVHRGATEYLVCLSVCRAYSIPLYYVQDMFLSFYRAYGIPSYYVQKLFSQYQGVSYIDTTVSADSAAASATCQDRNCSRLAIKVPRCISCPRLILTLVLPDTCM
jgi:Alpha-L-arabinofuranosidase C-terminal domain